VLSQPFNVRYANEYYPRFDTDSVASFNVSENETLATVIRTITATDQDQGIAGTIKYGIIDPTFTFNISENSGDILLQKALDRETKSSYVITVIATDGAPSPFEFTTTKHITIMVSDVNDNAPRFVSPSPMTTDVFETAIVGSVAASLRAVDLDDGANGQITYSILSSNDTNDYFELNVGTGELIIKSKWNSYNNFFFDILDIRVSSYTDSQMELRYPFLRLLYWYFFTDFGDFTKYIYCGEKCFYEPFASSQ